jgi:hypothetical protein
VVRTLVHTFHKTSFLLHFLRVLIVLVDQLRRLQRIESSGLYVFAYSFDSHTPPPNSVYRPQ